MKTSYTGMMVALLKRLRSENSSPQVADAGAAGTSSSRPSPLPSKPPAAAASKALSPNPASQPVQQPPPPRTVSHAQVLSTTRAPKGTFSVRESVGRVLHIAPADIHRMLLSVPVSLFSVLCLFSSSLLCVNSRSTHCTVDRERVLPNAPEVCAQRRAAREQRLSARRPEQQEQSDCACLGAHQVEGQLEASEECVTHECPVSAMHSLLIIVLSAMQIY